MIHFLRGKLVSALPTQVIVEVSGLGYEVLIPLSSFDKLPPPGGDLTILTHLSIREDAHVLYGFMTAAERDMFRLLIHAVSGIGPKTALNILSGINISALRSAVATGDVKSLSQISGVGKKTAERIVVELRDRAADFALRGIAVPGKGGIVPADPLSEAMVALQQLGYKPAEAARMAEKAREDGDSAEAIIRKALKAALR